MNPEELSRALEIVLSRIRHKCLDCCAGSTREVKLCVLTDCPLHQLREPRGEDFYLASILDGEEKFKTRLKFLESHDRKIQNLP